MIILISISEDQKRLHQPDYVVGDTKDGISFITDLNNFFIEAYFTVYKMDIEDY